MTRRNSPKSRRTSEGTVVVLAGAVDRGAADILLRELRRIWDSEGRPVVLNLAGVTYLDSGGLQALLVAHREAVAAGRSLTIEEASPTVRRLLDLTGTGDLFEPTRDPTSRAAQ